MKSVKEVLKNFNFYYFFCLEDLNAIEGFSTYLLVR